MNIAVVDIECNGLDTETVDIHCIVVQVPGEEPRRARPEEIHDAIDDLNRLIDEGYTLAGHNVIEYDFPILRRYGMKEPGQVLDTLLMSRAAYPSNTLFAADQKFLKRKAREHADWWKLGEQARIESELRKELKAGAHSLKAWGIRLGCPKDEYDGGWEEFSQTMLDYCVQDVASNVVLLDHLRARIPDSASLLECEVGQLCREMRLHGVGFDVKKAEELTVRLANRREELTKIFRDAFGCWVEKTGTRTPKRTQNRKHVRLIYGQLVECHRMVEGGTYEVGKEVEFNPASTEHIAKSLIAKYNWRPKHFTDGGKPQVTADVLRDLPYDEAPLLAEYQENKKVLGYLSEGQNAWLKLEQNGRIHGKVNPTGTVSGRASHNRPNTGNVPTRSALGHLCRELFTASTGKVIVGADASGLQLRILAHYLAKWDGGEFARQCEDGDIHEYMREATGLHVRDHQKTWTYAKLFGAGKTKLGQIAIVDHRAAVAKGLIDTKIPKQGAAGRIGGQTLTNLGDAIPAFTELEKELKGAAARGWLTTLDGRRLPISSEHIAIAMLLQGGEAVIMKQAMAYAAPQLRRLLAAYVLWVHDEFQTECRRDVADEVGETLVEAMHHAGSRFGLRVRIDGDYKIGATWAETH